MSNTSHFELPHDAIVAADLEERDIDWLIDERIPRGLITLVGGRPGQGKSAFTAWLAATVSQEAPVIFANPEDLKAETSRPRLRLVGAKLENVHLWCPDLGSLEGLHQLESFVNVFGVALLIIDPVSAFLSKGKKDDREHIARIQALLERTKLSLVAIDHTSKRVPKGAHPLEAIRGAGDGFQAAARFVYVFGPNPQEPTERVLAAAKANIAREASMAFAMELVEVEFSDGRRSERPKLTLIDDDSSVTAAAVVQYQGEQAEEEKRPLRLAIASEWLTSFLMFGPRKATDVEKESTKAGISNGTIRRASKSIGIKKSRVGGGKGSYMEWELPPEHPALQVGKSAYEAAVAASDDPTGLTAEMFQQMMNGGDGG